jgi:hypothetical protein
MKRLLIIAMVALALPAAALAKGASEATIEGPGFDGTVVIPGNGEDGGLSQLGRIAELGGFYPAVFLRSPNPMLATAPAGELGLRYTIRYVVPGPTGTSILQQDVYPYAQPAPVTYVKPSQRFWDGQRTVGGWYQSVPDLKRTLEEIGLPAQPPATGVGFWSGTPKLIGIFAGLAAVFLVVVAFAVLVRRRRLQPAATS